MPEDFGFSIYALCYGDYADLHRRLLDSFRLFAKPHPTDVTIWCNQACAGTEQLARGLGFATLCSAENLPKYKVMRDMFSLRPPKYEWILWFDDDSYIEKPFWYEATKLYIESRRSQNICYFGQPWFVHHLPGQWEFIKTMPWFKGKPPELIQGKPGITFAQGAYWGLRNDVRQLLDWPPSDRGLSHNGGDTLLGEAVRQQGLPFHKFHRGVKVNAAKRRGHSEAPAGSSNLNARR